MCGQSRLSRSRPCYRLIRPSRCWRGFTTKVSAPHPDCSELNCGTNVPSSHCRTSILQWRRNIMRKIALIAASLAVLATPVLAEDAKTTGTAPADAKFSTVSKDEMFSSKVKGLNVYNQKDESIGEITDLAIKNHQVDALILSVGGFLGMGEHYVAVSPSSVNIRYDSKNDKWLASMSTTKEALKAAPEFKYPK